jgi:dUTP pyrophosphatase
MSNVGNSDAAAEPLSVMVVQLPHARGLPLPSYQTMSAAGLDLVAAVQDGDPLTLQPGERGLVPTGLVLQIPEGFEAQVRPRSGLALRHGVTVLNSPGTIDADYRGEVMVLLINLGADTVSISRGERIAQIVFSPITQASFIAVKGVSDTARGSGGFGSTGA